MPLMPGAFGRDVHPSSTHGVLIRVYPVNSFVTQYKGPVDERDGPCVSGISRVIIAVEDIDRAVETYGVQFKMVMDPTQRDTERGVHAAICRPASGGVIELVAVDDSTRPFANAIADFLQNRREGMYALVLQTSDVPATQMMLVERGLAVSVSADSPDVLEVDQRATFGALIRIEAG